VWPRVFLFGFVAFWAVQPGTAQVEKLAMRTTGISCGICAGLSEIYFRRLPGVDQVTISLRNEAILLTYKPGATVDPESVRKVLEPLKVGVVQFQVSLRGEIRETGGRQILQAGKDRFVVRDTIDSPVLPLNTPLHIEAILFDRVTPREVKVLDFKLVR
jgi:hypothetical protein